MAGSGRLARVVYRSLLRASNNGENPEVLGEFGLSRLLLLNQNQKQHQQQNSNEDPATTVSSSSSPSSLSSLSQIFPSNAHQVRHHLKSVFRDETKKDTDIMFPALRLSNELSSILYPKVLVQEHFQQQKQTKKRSKHAEPTQKETLTQTVTEAPTQNDTKNTIVHNVEIPIFDFTSSSVLMGEQVRFHFFEPRYKLLVEKAMSSTDPHFQKMMILRGQILATEKTKKYKNRFMEQESTNRSEDNDNKKHNKNEEIYQSVMRTSDEKDQDNEGKKKKEEEKQHPQDADPPTTESDSSNNSSNKRRTRPGSSTTVVDVSMLLKIIERTELPNGNVSVKCMGGPRIHVLNEEMVAVGHPDNNLAPMAQTTEFLLGYDDDHEEDDHTTTNADDTETHNGDDSPQLLLLESLRNQCLELLLKTMVAQTKKRQQREPALKSSPTQRSGEQPQEEKEKTTTQGGEEREDDGNDDDKGENCDDEEEDLAILKTLLPSLVTLPPLDPERFSFWVLRFVIRPDDHTSRWWWLSCRSTKQRLQFVKFWLLQNNGQQKYDLTY